MSFNSSHISGRWCLFTLSKPSEQSSAYEHVTLAACVLTALLAPMAVVGNAFILAAIWRNPSLRTPSYVLLAGLAITDFFTGLLSQPCFVVYKLADVVKNGEVFCTASLLTECFGLFFSSLTFVVITIMAVERWLHMSRGSLLTVRRVVVLYIFFVVLLILLVFARIYNSYRPYEAYNVFTAIFLFAAALCVFVTAFAYFNVFQIIRRHQNQVQTNENAIDMKKYKATIFTIMYILAIFVVSYLPYLCSLLVFYFVKSNKRLATYNICAAVVFSSSFFNPLLYCWRIKEIRDSVRSIIRKLFCN